MGSKLIIFICLLMISSARSIFDDIDIKNLLAQLMALGRRIIGGRNAKAGEFPHHVTLHMGVWGVGSELEYVCGGSIISEQYILTAAHCVDGEEPMDHRDKHYGEVPSDFIVKAGKLNFNEKESSEQVALVDKWVKHEKWNISLGVEAGAYDIALLKLKGPLVLNERVAKIRLPKAGSEPTGDAAVLSGSGDVSIDAKNPEKLEVLQIQVVPIISREVCNHAMEKIFLIEELEKFVKNPVKETNVCTGPVRGGHGACSGDSGGPLILEADDGVLEVVGIVSWGIEPCGQFESPTVFTKVSAYVDWIENAKKSMT